MPGPLAMLGIQAGLGVGQSILGNRAAKREQQRMDEQAAQNKLISSFGKNAQPQQMGPQQGPGIGQQVLGDPLTKQLLAGLVGKIGSGAPSVGGVAGLSNPALLQQAPAPSYSTDIGRFTPRFK
tara:strand:+ start:1017 stop:1388 length:372 start_codon:yes stop_codon:yes gene_type:complete